MTGVSYMIPFVAAGGLLIALGFLLGGYEIAGPRRRHRRRQHAVQPAGRRRARPRPRALRLRVLAYLGAVLLHPRRHGVRFLVPALAGYIAYAIADRPGIAPGFVDRRASPALRIGAGFLGGIIGGLLAGVVAAVDRPAGRCPPGRAG